MQPMNDDGIQNLLNHLEEIFPIDYAKRRGCTCHRCRGRNSNRGSASFICPFDLYMKKILIQNARNIQSLIHIFNSTQTHHIKLRCVQILDNMGYNVLSQVQNSIQTCLPSLISFLSINHPPELNLKILHVMESIMHHISYTSKTKSFDTLCDVELLQDKLYNLYDNLIEKHNQYCHTSDTIGTAEKSILSSIQQLCQYAYAPLGQDEDILNFHPLAVNVSPIPFHKLDAIYVDYYQQLLNTNSLIIKKMYKLIQSNIIKKMVDYLAKVSCLFSYSDDRYTHIYIPRQYEQGSETYKNVISLLNALRGCHCANSQIHKLIAQHVFDVLEVVKPWGCGDTVYGWNINEQLVYQILDKHTIKGFMDCGIMNKTINTARKIVFDIDTMQLFDCEIFGRGGFKYFIGDCILKTISLMDNAQIIKFKDIDMLIQTATWAGKYHKYDHEVIVSKLASVIFISDDEERKLNICYCLDKIRYFSLYTTCNKLVIEGYISIVLKKELSDIIMRNEKLCVGYCRKMEKYFYFSDNLKYFVIRYLGSFNKLHVFSNSIVCYVRKECKVMSEIVNDMVTINIDNNMKKVKSFELERIELDLNSVNNYKFKFVKIMFGKHKGKIGQIKSIENKKFAVIAFSKALLLEVILLDFVFPIGPIQQEVIPPQLCWAQQQQHNYNHQTQQQ
eukprot:356367_1